MKCKNAARPVQRAINRTLFIARSASPPLTPTPASHFWQSDFSQIIWALPEVIWGVKCLQILEIIENVVSIVPCCLVFVSFGCCYNYFELLGYSVVVTEACQTNELPVNCQ